jgi:hypothetical protein
LPRRCHTKVKDLVAYYSSKISPHAYLAKLSESAAALIHKGHHLLAETLCSTSLQLLSSTAAQDAHLTPQKLASYKSQALFGQATCSSTILLTHDPQIKHPDTLSALVADLQKVQDGISHVVPHEDLFWVVYNGTVHMHSLALPLVQRGFQQQAFPMLLFCVKALEASVVFCSPDMLRWRLQLYTMLVHCYRAMEAQQQGQQVLQAAREQISHLRQLHQLDPVPVPADVLQAYQQTEAQLWALDLQLQQAPGADDLQVPQQMQHLVRSSAQRLQLLVSVLQPLCTGALERCTMEPHHKQLLGLAVKQVSAVVKAQTAPSEQPAAAAAAAAGLETGEADEPYAGDDYVSAYEPLPHAQLTHLLLAAFRFQHQELLLALQDAVSSCKAPDGGNMQPGGDAARFAAVSEVLAAVSAMDEQQQQQAYGSPYTSLSRLTAVLAAHSSSLALQHPDLLRDAALLLHQRAHPLLSRVACLEDDDSGLALDMCQVLHQVFTAVDLDDALLRVQCSLQAALLLEESDHLAAALEVLQQGLEACDRARSEAGQALRGRPDQHLMWASASRSQSTEAAKELLKGRQYRCWATRTLTC